MINKSALATDDLTSTVSSSEYTMTDGSINYLLVLAASFAAILLQFFTTSRNEARNERIPINASSLQYKRRLQHASTGLLFFAISFVLPRITCIILLSTATMIFFALHKARSKSIVVQDYYMKQFGPILRDHEKSLDTLPGAFWFLVGTTIVVSLFPINIARTSLLCLSFGDPLAAIVGILVGGPKMYVAGNRSGSSKSVSGCFACFFTCYLVALLCMNNYGMKVWMLTGLVATLMETLGGRVSTFSVDDNISIPVGTGSALWLYTTYFYS